GMAPVVKGLRDDSIVSNQTLVLECSIQGTPLPIIAWYKDGDQLLPTDRHTISSSKSTRDRGRNPRNARGGGGGGGSSSSSRRGGGHVMGQVARRRGKRRRGGRPGPVSGATAVDDDDDPIAGRANTAEGPTDTPGRTRRRKGNGRKGDRRNNGNKRGRGRTRGSRRRGGGDDSNSTKGEPPAGEGGGNRRKPGNRNPSQKPGGGSPTTSVTVVSVLEVSRITAQDVGLYKCVATNVVGEAHSQAHIRVVKPIEPHPGVKYCDPDHASYCLNGGTCMLYTDFNEYIC
ncbi:unnamed protein product, partial [Meganyctiphanes norvegica]